MKQGAPSVAEGKERIRVSVLLSACEFCFDNFDLRYLLTASNFIWKI